MGIAGVVRKELVCTVAPRVPDVGRPTYFSSKQQLAEGLL
jgi:hypothetical protein